MDFIEAREIFLRPREGAAAPRPETPARRLRHVLEPPAMVNVWSAPAHEHLAKAGLDFLTGYVGGRACVLGNPSPGVVAATFAVFEPGSRASSGAGPGRRAVSRTSSRSASSGAGRACGRRSRASRWPRSDA